MQRDFHIIKKEVDIGEGLCVALVGTKHYDIPPPYLGDTLLLVPEPNNEFDKYAVAVFTKQLKQVGYVRQRDQTSKYVSDRLKGKPTSAQVCFVDDYDKNSPIILLDRISPRRDN